MFLDFVIESTYLFSESGQANGWIIRVGISWSGLWICFLLVNESWSLIYYLY